MINEPPQINVATVLKLPKRIPFVYNHASFNGTPMIYYPTIKVCSKSLKIGGQRNHKSKIQPQAPALLFRDFPSERRYRLQFVVRRISPTDSNHTRSWEAFPFPTKEWCSASSGQGGINWKRRILQSLVLGKFAIFNSSCLRLNFGAMARHRKVQNVLADQYCLWMW